MIKVKDYYNFIDTWAPFDSADDYDNVGLLCGDMECDVLGVIIALDITPEVINEAKDKGANLIISHHPIIFGGIDSVTLSSGSGSVCYALAQNSMNAICAHTNLDAADGGVNDTLAEVLELKNIEFVEENTMMRVGELSAAMEVLEFAQHVKNKLGAERVRVCGIQPDKIKKVALLGGSGGSYLMQAKNTGADIFLVGDAKQNEGIEAQTMNFCMMDAGHYETEVLVLKKVHSYLQKCTNEVQSINGIHITCVHTGPFEVLS